jgi:hypothetical protein
MLSFVISWIPYFLKMMRRSIPLPSYLVDWASNWSVFHQQCMMLWQFLITAVYWGCPLYWGCPYNAASMQTTEEVF